jgi:predicted nucleotidyltransferase
MNRSNVRAEMLEREFKRVLPILIREYSPRKIILYGSFANGNVQEWSDIDLVIIKESKKKFCDRIAEVLSMLRPEVGMDIAVYTPAEWEALCKERRFVQEEILNGGRELYAA